MATVSPAVLVRLLELGHAAAKVVRDVRDDTQAGLVPAAGYEPRPARTARPEPEDVLEAIEVDAERLLRGEIAARQRLRYRRDRAANDERAATGAAARLVRQSSSPEAGAADPQAIAFMSRALSLRRDIEALDVELASAEAQVAVVQAFAGSLRGAGDDMRRTLGALRRGHEQTQRLTVLTGLTERFLELTGMVGELTDRLDAARAEAEAGQLGALRPDVAMFLARGRLADAEAGDELRRLWQR